MIKLGSLFFVLIASSAVQAQSVAGRDFCSPIELERATAVWNEMIIEGGAKALELSLFKRTLCLKIRSDFVYTPSATSFSRPSADDVNYNHRTSFSVA